MKLATILSGALVCSMLQLSMGLIDWSPCPDTCGWTLLTEREISSDNGTNITQVAFCDIPFCSVTKLSEICQIEGNFDECESKPLAEYDSILHPLGLTLTSSLNTFPKISLNMVNVSLIENLHGEIELCPCSLQQNIPVQNPAKALFQVGHMACKISSVDMLDCFQRPKKVFNNIFPNYPSVVTFTDGSKIDIYFFGGIFFGNFGNFLSKTIFYLQLTTNGTYLNEAEGFGSLPKARGHHCSIEFEENFQKYAFIIGGTESSALLVKFTSTQNLSFSTVFNLTQERHYPACSIVDNKIFIIGGFFYNDVGSVIYTSTIEMIEINPAWLLGDKFNETVLSDVVVELPIETSSSSTFGLNSDLYIFGGKNSTGSVGDIFVLDTENFTVKHLSSQINMDFGVLTVLDIQDTFNTNTDGIEGNTCSSITCQKSYELPMQFDNFTIQIDLGRMVPVMEMRICLQEISENLTFADDYNSTDSLSGGNSTFNGSLPKLVVSVSNVSYDVSQGKHFSCDVNYLNQTDSDFLAICPVLLARYVEVQINSIGFELGDIFFHANGYGSAMDIFASSEIPDKGSKNVIRDQMFLPLMGPANRSWTETFFLSSPFDVLPWLAIDLGTTRLVTAVQVAQNQNFNYTTKMNMEIRVGHQKPGFNSPQYLNTLCGKIEKMNDNRFIEQTIDN